MIALFLANFYILPFFSKLVNHFFIFFSDFRVFQEISFFFPRHASLSKNNPVSSHHLPATSWLLCNCVINSIQKQELFLSCFCCVSFVSSDLYIIAHLEIFVNTFFKLFSLNCNYFFFFKPQRFSCFACFFPIPSPPQTIMDGISSSPFTQLVTTLFLHLLKIVTIPAPK